MIYRKLDPNGDYSFGQRPVSFLVNSPDAVGQAVMTALKLFQGEWFVDISVGVPYNTKILGFNNVVNVDYEIQSAILGVPGVSSIVSYSSYYAPTTRNIIISATINTVYGTTTVSSIL